MLRVGLTGGLGSGKSTVAGMFAELGAAVISADQLGRQLMQLGEPVYAAIVNTFGKGVVRSDGSLDRKKLAELAFQHNQADALNHIVHPAVVAAEEEWMRGVFAKDPTRVAMVESALIFEVEKWGTAPGWVQRFDKLILVTVPDEVKIARFVARMGTHDAAQMDARARLAMQIPDREKVGRCDYVIDNTGSLEATRALVEKTYQELVQAAR
ncbi:MAG: dephospho-CoA kinase [Acidobacteriaceae bacterium]|jgi:dephospho-CoA kinase|nr:dephospho-CoA kinase [Acidobacteriaceae bacterium]